MSWCGVRTVLTSTVSDPPGSLPLAAEAASPAGTRVSARPRPPLSTPPASGPSAAAPSGGSGPAASASRGPSSGGRGPDGGQGPGSSPPSTHSAHPTRSAPDADPSGTVRGYTVRGGQVVFDLRSDSAELVSATPDTGWQMQVWKQSEWIRVDFTSGADATSVFCTWNDGPPTVQVDQH
jgi:hypothetical protein